MKPDDTNISDNQGDVIGVGVGGSGNVVGKNITITQNYLVVRGVDPLRGLLEGPSEPWDLASQGTIPVDTLRKQLLLMNRLEKPTLVTVQGTLYPATLLTPGWWELKNETVARPNWQNGLQKWLFYGFDLWGPSWDFSWDFDTPEDYARPYFPAQLGDGDEAASLSVLIPHDKAMKLRELFSASWGGLEVTVTGLLGHRHQFPKISETEGLPQPGGLLDYCIWLQEDSTAHKVSLLVQETEVYSGYLWRCVAPKDWVVENKPPSLELTYFIWEHTNFADRDAIKYNLESLNHKESYIASMHGDLVLLTKSSALVPGIPRWSPRGFYNLLSGKAGKDI